MEIATVGGYREVGKNMTAVKVGNDAVVLDMGFYLPSLIDFEEEGGDRSEISTNELKNIGAIPDMSVINAWRKNVRCIGLGHCHLDHIGAVPYLSNRFPNATIMGTPYTLEVLRTMILEEQIKMDNKFKIIQPNADAKLAKNLKIEFINMTHSTLQCTMMAVHTKEGVVLYANDFKFDNHPIVGKKPNLKRLKELGEKGIKALVVESIYAGRHRKTPSEKVAREMLKDVMLNTENEGNLIVASTFASHIARLKSIIDFGEQLNRQIVIMGRSMHKYITSAENLKLINFSQRADILGYSRHIKKKLKEIEKQGRGKYLIICTGGQGEPGSIMQRMATNQMPFEFQKDDHVIFSNKIIPAEINKIHRAELEEQLQKKKTRIFSDIHVSGHAGREDLRDLIKITNPEHLIPAHGDQQMLKSFAQLAEDMGYHRKKNVHVMDDEKILKL
ncbi:MAG: RNase J family beta-CASP ribonuclease [Nanoarchaeota archaeon]|nr:RNase J family beta-CASP ribonuclease [Nanoarchaeota archaeon]MCG2718377.1 RNase J family beta-CASP ribonuclease [Nanoarchaeota archaeon]